MKQKNKTKSLSASVQSSLKKAEISSKSGWWSQGCQVQQMNHSKSLAPSNESLMKAVLLAKNWVSSVEFSLSVAMVPPPVPSEFIFALLAIPNSLSLPAPT